SNTTLGAIQKITITSAGFNYDTAPTIDLSQSGDGTATATASILDGVFTYPGRYLNDDGQVSSFNFLQDRDYYQNFPYVVRVQESIDNYRKMFKELVHPAGMKMFGEYTLLEENQNYTAPTSQKDAGFIKFNHETFIKTGNTINISYATQNTKVNDSVYLSFTENVSINNVTNGIYKVTNNSHTNWFTVKQYSNILSIAINNAGRLYNSNSNLVITGDGSGANAYYTINSNGSIVSVNVLNYGIDYTSTPSVTANGSNSVAATFDVLLAFANNRSEEH